MKTRMTLTVVCLAALLGACGGKTMQSSSSSHWVECQRDAECPFAMGSVGCVQSYCVDADQERIEIAGPSSNIGTTSGNQSSPGCDPADPPYVIEYHVATDDGLRLVVTRPDADIDYETFRVFFSRDEQSVPVVERVVVGVSRQRDGGTTDITFRGDGEEIRAHFPVTYDEETEVFSHDEPATVTVGGEEISAPRRELTAAALDDYQFLCFPTGPVEVDPPEMGDPRPCMAAHVRYPAGTVRDLGGCGTNVCTCSEDGTWQECGGVEIVCYWGLPVRPCSEMFPDREPGEPVPGADDVSVVEGWLEGNRLRLELQRPAVNCRIGTIEMCFDPPTQERVDLHVVEQYLECEDASPLTPPTSYGIGFDLTPVVDALPEGAGLVETDYGHLASASLTCEERLSVSNEHVGFAIDQLSKGCETDDDCVVVERATGCNFGCPVTVSRDQTSSFEVTLSTMETFCDGYDTQCEAVLVPPCVDPGMPACVAGQCVFE